MTTRSLEISRTAYPPRVRVLTVAEVQELSPTMRRFVLTGDELEPEFPFLPLTTAMHVKVVVPQESSRELVMPTLGDRGLAYPEGIELAVRDYTVRSVDAARQELTLDFVLHDHGPAGRWAVGAKPGNHLGVMGPRGYTVYPDGYSRYVLGADETALPALERWIEEAPQKVRIDAFILAIDTAWRELPPHPGLTAHWLEETGSYALASALTDAIPANDEQTYLWAAAESGIVGPVRRHLSAAGFTRTAFDVSGYWRQGLAGSGEHEDGAHA